MLNNYRKVTLEAAAALANRDEEEILRHAGKGDFHLCITVPKNYVVYCTCCEDESTQKRSPYDVGKIFRLGPSPEFISNVISLALTSKDAKRIWHDGQADVKEFSFGFVLPEEHEKQEAILVKPSMLGYYLKLYKSNSIPELPSDYSYGKAISLKVKREDVLFIREEIEDFIFDPPPNQVRYGNFRPQPYTSKKLAALNEASTYVYCDNGLNGVYSKSKVEVFLQKKGFSETLANRTSYFINKDHNPKRGISADKLVNSSSETTLDIDEFKPNDYTSNMLAFINKAAMLLNQQHDPKDSVETWLKERCGFNATSIKFIIEIIENN